VRAVALLLVVLVAGCPGAADLAAYNGDDGSGAAPECTNNAQCIAAAAKCCDCPTFAVPSSDPAFNACKGVDCPSPGPMCAANLAPACDDGACVLACAPTACEMSCADGFATDANGCLVCSCAIIEVRACSGDNECSRVRDDCCGCAHGGKDTAVPNAEVQTHDANLMCTSNPYCPGVDTCPADLAPRCVQGACELISGGLPGLACGRTDLMDCAAGSQCTLNSDATATAEGVGVCVPTT
jgi:hypothetical protein